MKLHIYMGLKGISDASLAKLVDRDRSSVTKWRNGTQRPDWSAISALEAATDGAVTAQDFLAHSPKKESAA